MKAESTWVHRESVHLEITRLVFSRSIRALLNPFVDCGPYGKLSIMDIIEWMYPWCSFSDPSQQHPYSFPNVCSRLDLDPVSVQQFCIDFLSDEKAPDDDFLRLLYERLEAYFDLRWLRGFPTHQKWPVSRAERLAWIFSSRRSLDFLDQGPWQQTHLSPMPPMTFEKYMQGFYQLEARREAFRNSIELSTPTPNRYQSELFLAPAHASGRPS